MSLDKKTEIRVREMTGPLIRRKSNFTGKVSVSFNGYTAMIYNTGKIILLGVRNPSEVIPRAKDELQKFLRDQGYDVSIATHKIENFVFSGSTGASVDMGGLFTKLQSLKQQNNKSWNIVYEPEYYPAIKLTDNEKGVALIYRTGKVITTKSKVYEEGQMYCEEVLRYMR